MDGGRAIWEGFGLGRRFFSGWVVGRWQRRMCLLGWGGEVFVGDGDDDGRVVAALWFGVWVGVGVGGYWDIGFCHTGK